jgi:hypothetical protein
LADLSQPLELGRIDQCTDPRRERDVLLVRHPNQVRPEYSCSSSGISQKRT